MLLNLEYEVHVPPSLEQKGLRQYVAEPSKNGQTG
jgi:hypothetical protein